MPRARTPALIGGCLALLVGVGLAVVWQISPTTGSAASGRHASVTFYVAAGGNDQGDCTNALAPCASLGAAYRKAAPGDVVLISTGEYPAQTIGGPQAGEPSEVSHWHGRVTFLPAPGAAVRFTGRIEVFGSHVLLQNMTVQDVVVGNYDQTPGRINPTDVELAHLRGRNFQIDSATDVTVKGGSWGPASACGGPYGGTNNSIRDITGVVPTRISIDSVVIHDVQSYDLTNCHIEGLAIFAGRDVSVTNSRFYGNSVYDVFVQANSGPISGLRFVGNWMAMPVGTNGVENGTVIGFSSISSEVLVKDNRFNYI